MRFQWYSFWLRCTLLLIHFHFHAYLYRMNKMIKHIINQPSNCVPFWQPQKVGTLVGTVSENTYMARCVQG